MKKLTLSKAKKKAWKAFSLYIRLRGAVDDYVTCYTCGKSKHFKEMSAGHGIGGRNNAILFDERIVKPQCAGCNIWGRGQYQIFTRKLISELGLDTYDEIVTNSSNVLKRSINDYLEIEKRYITQTEKL